MNRFGTILLPLLLCGIAAGAQADTLLIERVQQANPALLPDRGLSMAQVQARRPVGVGVRPGEQDGGLGFPFRREAQNRVAHRAGLGPSSPEAWFWTASMTLSRSKYTVNAG